jgi:single-strand DNA-binding protein
MGGDPEMRFTADGKAVANFSLATSYGKGDNKQTTWHRIIVWERSAEFVKEYCYKGNLIFVEGRIQTRQYDDKDGIKRHVTEIIASNVQKLIGENPLPTSRDAEPDDQEDLPF